MAENVRLKMADNLDSDLFDELSELSEVFHTKESNTMEILGVDDIFSEDLLPSNIVGDILAVDSSNVLLGDPMLEFGVEGRQSDPQGLIFPETLMSVSLPVEPARPVADTSDDLQSPATPSAEVAGSSQPGRGKSAPEQPVKICVRTISRPKQSTMVAPIVLKKPHHSLVSIPKSNASHTQDTRLQVIRAGGKLGSTRSVNSSHSQQSRQTSVTEPVELREVAAATDIPFTSLRRRNHSGRSSSPELPRVFSSHTRKRAYEYGPCEDPQMEKCRKNAINAKRNRDIKKARLVELESTVENVSKERDLLAAQNEVVSRENESLRNSNEELEMRVRHLENVLKNQSKLAALLNKIEPQQVSISDVEHTAGDFVVSSASGQ
ncbi:uncharacterized protein LOC143026986 isoform X2 [Oratosquilla oratoria]|uniref:uncharacterized protein LOC143026986 isoform X2 n=1 Tax=Oratosquilla oratoria TaxID=337810 RepID=UPI003F76A29C